MQQTWWEWAREQFGYAGPPPKAILQIAIMSKQVIASSLDYIGKLGWGAIAGEGGSIEEIAGDFAFSMIPVLGAWGDARDFSNEAANFWPGGLNPNLLVFGISFVSMLTSFMGPQADWLPNLAKQMAKVMDASKGVWQSVMDLARRLDFDTIGDLRPLLMQLIDPANLQLKRLAEDVLVKDAADLGRLKKIIDGLGTNGNGAEEAANFFTRIKDSADLGEVAARKVLGTLGNLSPNQIETIFQTGRLDHVAEAISLGLGNNKLETYAKWLDEIKTNPTARIPFADAKHDAIDKYLLGQGMKVEPNLLAKEWIDTDLRQADRYINNIKTEYKMPEVGKIATSGTIKGEVNDSLRRGGQAREIIIDARDSGLSPSEASRAFGRVGGITRGLLDKLSIIMPDGQMLWENY